MRLSFLNDQAKTDLRQGTRIKFVMIAPTRDPDPTDVVVLLFPGSEWHAATVKTLLNNHPGFVPVGGGKIEGVDIWWESNSFEDEFGYDRPAEIGTQELLLQGLTTALQITN